MEEHLSTFLHGIGFLTVYNSSYNAKLLLLQRFLRLFAYGASFLILVQFLTKLGISDKHAGLFMTLTMLGDALISFLLVLVTDRIGRRKILALGAVLMSGSGLIFATSSTYWVLVVASVVGVISPSGNEIGPFRAVEESILSQLTEKDDRTDIFAWYAMCGTAGTAIGTITSGWLIEALSNGEQDDLRAYRIIFTLYAALGALKLLLVIALSPGVELHHEETKYHEIQVEDEELLSRPSSPDDLPEERAPDPPHNASSRAEDNNETIRKTLIQRASSLLLPISPQSLLILLRLIALFTLDSFASGMASPSWLTYFFTTFHNIDPGILGTLFFTTNILATISNSAALPLARRLGPLKTMAFTHLPSAVFLGMIPFPSSGAVGTPLCMGLLALRACSQSMDQAPRQAFLAAVMRPEERTAMFGIVNIVKTIAQAGGIGTSGVLAATRSWRIMFGSAGLLKVSYDLLILWTFLHLPDREDTRD